MQPSELERKAHAILSLLNTTDAVVELNRRIPDPDNPSQLRQIDVSIRRDEALTIVECRSHAKPQDVTWIEELCGRRLSLGASGVIAVSDSGYSAGAIAKAERLGVILRDFRALTDLEIVTWGKRTKVNARYFRFNRLRLNPIGPRISVRVHVSPFAMLTKRDGEAWPVDTMLRRLASVLGEKQHEGSAKIQLFPEDLYLGTVPIDEVIAEVRWDTVVQSLALPSVRIFSHPEDPDLQGVPIVESQEGTQLEIYKVTTGGMMILDYSLTKPLYRGILTAIDIALGEPLPMSGIKIVGHDKEAHTVIPFQVRPVLRDSLLCHSLRVGMHS